MAGVSDERLTCDECGGVYLKEQPDGGEYIHTHVQPYERGPIPFGWREGFLAFIKKIWPLTHHGHGDTL